MATALLACLLASLEQQKRWQLQFEMPQISPQEAQPSKFCFERKKTVTKKASMNLTQICIIGIDSLPFTMYVPFFT